MPSEEDHFIPQGSIGNSSKESERTPQLDNHRMEMEPNGYPSKIGYNNDETFSERECDTPRNSNEVSSRRITKAGGASPVLNKRSNWEDLIWKKEGRKLGNERYYESELDRTTRLSRSKQYHHYTLKPRNKHQKKNQIKSEMSKTRENGQEESMLKCRISPLQPGSTTPVENNQSTPYRNRPSSRLTIWEFDDGTIVNKRI